MKTQEFAALGEAQGYSGSVKLGQLWALTGISFVAAAAKSLQSCPTLCDPIDGSPPGSPSVLQWLMVGPREWVWALPVLLAELWSGESHLPVQETRVRPLGWENPLEEEITTSSGILA